MQKQNMTEWIRGNAKLRYVSFKWCTVTFLGICGGSFGIQKSVGTNPN